VRKYCIIVSRLIGSVQVTPNTSEDFSGRGKCIQSMVERRKLLNSVHLYNEILKLFKEGRNVTKLRLGD